MSIHLIRKITGTLFHAAKEVGLQETAEKSKCMLPNLHQDSGQNQDINIGNRSFEDVPQFKYMETRATNQNVIQEDIYGGLNSGNA
jgi:hypothetical protein